MPDVIIPERGCDMLAAFDHKKMTNRMAQRTATLGRSDEPHASQL